MPASKKVVIIGSGFAGLSAASFMAKAGWDVTVFEKNETPGGRARQWKEKGFTFDMGPSFYWMPDVFERFFAQFGKEVNEFYQLQRLDPSYRVYWESDYTNLPAGFERVKALFESMEKGAGDKLEKYLREAFYKYDVGINNLVYKPGLSFTEFLEWKTIKGVARLDVFTSIRKHISKHFKHPRLRRLMEFPVLFLGALPEDTPALYSLMNYADICGGTWYPHGGMYTVVTGMHRLAEQLGVRFRFNEEVKEIKTANGRATGVVTASGYQEADAVISAADYHFTETKLLPETSRSYSDQYWSRRVMAPSCLMYYVGLNKKLNGIPHHSLFFDVPFAEHGHEIYREPRWPSNPLFYVSAASVTDDTVAPAGCENLVFLVPVAAGLQGDSEELRDAFFEKIIKRLEVHTGESIRDAVLVKHTYSVSDFENDYHSFRGNAYGLANTLRQTALLRPACKSRKLRNLFYTGQLTVPGPGVPPSLISGEVVAGEVIKMDRKNKI